jgi:hypothetical protein
MKNKWIICLMLFVCMFSFTAVWAQEKKPDPKEMVDFEKQVELFIQVVSFAESKKDSLMMIGAVRMMDSLPFDGIAKPGPDEKAKYDRIALLNQAKEYAGDDKEVLAMIDKLKEVPEKTAVRHHGGHRGGHHGGHHGGYHGGGYWHERRHHCTWFRVCGHYGCAWVCR